MLLDEVKLPARATVLVPVDELSVHLAIQIDFQGGIHAHQVIVLRDYVDVVDIGRCVALHRRVVINKFVHLVIANGKCEYVFTRMNRLFSPIRHTALHQMHQSVTE